MRIAVLSDTHLMGRQSLDDLGPEAGEFLATVDLILHAGDVTLPAHLGWCEQFAPVLCAQGNNDHFEHAQMREVVVVEHEGWRIGAVHDLAQYAAGEPLEALKRRVYGDTGLDILVSGDTHFERLEYAAGTLILDSASPTLAHHKSTRLGSMALIEVRREHVHAEIVPLGETPGLPNPVTAASVDFDRGGLRGATLAGAKYEADLASGFRWRGQLSRRLVP